MRVFSNKGTMELSGIKGTWFELVRLLIIGCIPIINICFAIVYIYYSVFTDNKKFIDLVNKKS